MFLETLFDPATAAGFQTAWPDKPSVHDLPADSKLPIILSAETLEHYLETGCVPAREVNLIRSAAPCHPSSFTADGYLDPVKVRAWRQAGFTIQLRNVQRWHPATAWLMATMRRETGCEGYVSAFVTPPGEQGLEWHWDQYLGVVVQLAGSKTWELWEPVVDAPTRDYRTSLEPWAPEWLPRWKDGTPDMRVELEPGQVLILPRGWVHNAHSRDSATDSVHLTFVLQERTPLWLAEQMTAAAINDAAFRQALPLDRLRPDTITGQAAATRTALIAFLNGTDLSALGDLLAVPDQTPRSGGGPSVSLK